MPVVKRKLKDGFNEDDRTHLTYYKSWICGNTTTAKLLKSGDGQCGAWARFFIDALGEQGINHQNEHVVFYQSDGAAPGDWNHGFVVKNWAFATGSGISGQTSYPYLNIPDSPLVSGSPNQPYQYNWRFAEVNDVDGIRGQGTSNPSSRFSNHQVVKLGTTYYDPSYGVTYTSLEEVDTDSIDGFFKKLVQFPVNELQVGLDLNGDGQILDVQVLTDVQVFKKNSAGNQLLELFSEYP